MRVERINIQVFRSLYDVTLEPRHLSVLVGPNNAGKTNIADALQFLGEVARHGLEVAISRTGGYENIAFRRRRRTKRPVRFAIEAVIGLAELGPRIPGPDAGYDGNLRVKYEFSFRASSQSREADYAVEAETLELTIEDVPDPERLFELEPGILLRLERRGEQISVAYGQDVAALREQRERELRDVVERGRRSRVLDNLLDPLLDDRYIEFLRERSQPTNLIVADATYNVVLRYMLDTLARTRLYQLTPVECRKSGSPTPNPELDRHGGNLPAVVRYMQRNQRSAWQATLAAMRRIVPDLVAIETDFTLDRRLSLLFVETGSGRPWTSAEVSDGTIQSLALFTSLFDPRVPLAFIEEPENSVHPWIVRSFVDACRDVAAKQVFVTTHSPALIGYLRPDELSVVWRDEGRTHIAPLPDIDPQSVALWREGELDTFQLVDAGWIRESLPAAYS